MKFTEVSFTETFPIYSDGREVRWQKIYCKAELDQPDDDRRQALYECKKTVQSFFFESNKADEKKETITRGMGGSGLLEGVAGSPAPPLEDQIKSCKELKVLESYKMIVKGKPELEEIYNNRLKELT